MLRAQWAGLGLFSFPVLSVVNCVSTSVFLLTLHIGVLKDEANCTCVDFILSRLSPLVAASCTSRMRPWVRVLVNDDQLRAAHQASTTA